MAAKHPAKPEQMKPLSSAAQATPRKKVPRHVAESKPKQKPSVSERKPQDR
jgi:hypothetical protein